MEHTLAEVTLKSGEAMTVVKVVAPAPDWRDRILPFLQHKGDPWLWQMGTAFDEGLGDATMNFFEGVLDDGTIIGNITTAESHDRPIGLLQHVFTPEAQRRKGICSHLMQALCDDFRARDGRVMYLHTGHDSAPYHIYESFGFVGYEDTGSMALTLDESFRSDYFWPAETTVHDTDWVDWVPLEALSETVSGWQMRNFYLGKYGFSGFEADYIRLRKDMASGNVQQFKVLRTEAGAVPGYAMLGRCGHWPGKPFALDAFVHPHFYGDTAKLIDAIELPEDETVLAFADSSSCPKLDALSARGFAQLGAVPGLLASPKSSPLDLIIACRPGA